MPKIKNLVLLIALFLFICVASYMFFLQRSNSSGAVFKSDAIANLTLVPSSIPVSQSGLSIKNDLEKINKALLVLKYTNNTAGSIDPKILIGSSRIDNFGIYSNKNAILDRTSDHEGIGKNQVVFTAPRLEPNSSQESTFWVFATKQGEIDLSAEIIDQTGKSIKTNDVTLIVK